MLKLFNDADVVRPLTSFREIRTINDIWRWLKWLYVSDTIHSSPACWPERASWAWDGVKGDTERPGRRSGNECRADAARCGSCWCGKYRSEAGYALEAARQAERDAVMAGMKYLEPEGR